jgi:hypothetical protein
LVSDPGVDMMNQSKANGEGDWIRNWKRILKSKKSYFNLIILATAFQGQKKASPSMITPRGR